LNLDAIGEHVDAIVGVVLVAMGLYGLAQASKKCCRVLFVPH
jgi:hypothetical protein